MARINGTFQYKTISQPSRGPGTGWITATGSSEWLDGCECQIEKSIPAKQIIGSDGQTYAYTYDVFIPKYFNGELAIGAQFKTVSEDGYSDEFTIRGVDNMNRKYIEVWG